MNPQPKSRPSRSKKYQNWIVLQPCCLTGYRATEYLGVDPHHENRPGESGTSTKPCDSRCVPIRHDLHVMMESPGHSRKEVYARYGIDPEQVISKMQEKWQQDHKIFW